jgi:hypothetical protein
MERALLGLRIMIFGPNRRLRECVVLLAACTFPLGCAAKDATAASVDAAAGTAGFEDDRDAGGAGGQGGFADHTVGPGDRDGPDAADGGDRADASDDGDGDPRDVFPSDEKGTGCACVPVGQGETRMTLECACALGLCCFLVPLGNGLSIWSVYESVSTYDDCGLTEIRATNSDSPIRVYTIDTTSGSLVGLSYAPWSVGMLPVDSAVFCGSDSGGSNRGGNSMVVAGRSADGCIRSANRAICPPPEAGVEAPPDASAD